MRAKRLGLILCDKYVILVFMGIKRNLLLVASCRIHMGVRMQVTTSGVLMPEDHTRTKSNVSGNVLHGFGIQRRLKLRRHETITVPRVHQASKMDRKHCAVKPERHNDEAEGASEKVFEP